MNPADLPPQLHLDGALRGCIGNIVGRGPLYGTVAAMALAAAFKDHRFRPLTAEEFDEMKKHTTIGAQTLESAYQHYQMSELIKKLREEEK